jgi:hypothetical protein
MPMPERGIENVVEGSQVIHMDHPRWITRENYLNGTGARPAWSRGRSGAARGDSFDLAPVGPPHNAPSLGDLLAD